MADPSAPPGDTIVFDAGLAGKTIDLATLAAIFGNDPSTSDDDVFGVFAIWP